MTQAPSSLYRSVVSARSRRYRTIGIVLLAAILGMTVYGNYRLMPALRISAKKAGIVRYREAHPAVTPAGQPILPTPEQATADERTKQVALTQVIFAYAYWSVLFLLVLALLCMAWLDLREVLRNYSQRRREIWKEAIAQAGRGSEGRKGPTED